MYYVRLFVFSISVLYLDPDMWDVRYQDLYLTQCICISALMIIYLLLFTSLYIFYVDHVMILCTLFPLYILSLSCILYLLDLSLAETVKRTYGQWMVYGEFNTLGFVFSPRLTYKFQGRYSWYQSSWFHSSKGYPVFGCGASLGFLGFIES